MYRYKIDNKKSLIVCIGFFSIFIALTIRLYILMMYPTTSVQGELENHQVEYTSDSNYKLFDANGKSLINYKSKYVMVLDTKPFKLNNYEETLEDLLALNFIMKSEDEDFNFTDIMNQSGKLYYTITEETYEKLNKLNDIKGIYTYVYDELDLKERWNVENMIASIDKNNVEEGSFESSILDIISENKRPTIGFHLDEKSIYRSNETNYGENNKNIRLTIDEDWSDKIRNVLNSDDYSNLDNVGVVLLEANTGKIKSMVQKDESEANINLGIGQLGLEPGSIFKVITEAIALNEGLVNVSDSFSCNGNICSNSGKSYSHGTLTLGDALEVSCNDIFAKVGQLIGYKNMLKYTTNLGLYNKVLGLAGENREEAIGVMAKQSDGISNFAIGQCITVTPLQIAGAINAVVNDGVYIKPSLIEAIVDEDNNVIESAQNEENRIFSSTTSKLVKNNMYDVIWQGTGSAAKIEGITQGGKTGTATGEGGATTHGWFAGYFELNGKIYTLVISVPNIKGVDQNGNELGGGNTAAPIYREIIKSLMQ
ncbi:MULTISPECIES: penicillin-binding transpeptidase domain-containing protein [unclassified Clostridium]|uniref:penicillin-binding transpeptidase domain-containing protein n=1 Tax=Clostridium TaxID=1485 RepID=UPI0021AB0D63|nr:MULTISPECIES: penicillin-binding transpeptidase domain-containing protein [unclassified Clostridium]MDU2288748.1 penicillin-binding transpeptidase domain-containing protein [Clostridium celatum]